MPHTLQAIVAAIGVDAQSLGEAVINGISTLEHATPSDITFLANRKYAQLVAASQAGAIIVGPRDRDLTDRPRIVTANPYAYFARVVALFHPPHAAPVGVHPTAVVAATATIDARASIGPYCIIEEHASIAADVVLAGQVSIGRGVSVGPASHLHARVVIEHGCRVGARAIIHAGVVIGADGFGFAPVDGQWLKIPQVGAVVIGDDVEIGANTTIDRGALRDTVIEDGVKLDNQIQIGHNVRVGAHSALAGCVGVAGSADIGKHCMIGGGTVVLGHLRIADGTTIQAMSLVTRSINEAGVYSSALPVMPQDEWLKVAAQLRRLPALSDKLRALTQGRPKDAGE
jgi:UDP-3-O-[3-hydroxymyristoyl] glucosamine N-acyltransferase